jgi:hypothetical protein
MREHQGLRTTAHPQLMEDDRYVIACRSVILSQDYIKLAHEVIERERPPTPLIGTFSW